MDISLELVPRDKECFVGEVEWAKNHVAAITHLNIPDLVRIPNRSWEAARWVADNYPVIVHVRACDISAQNVEDFYQVLRDHNISDILVVQGDRVDDTAPSMSSLDMIRELRSLDTSLRLYAAIDPYRQPLSKELRYAERKMIAGIQGFLTQPFFDERLLANYTNACRGLSVWWGVTPILSEKSLSYWREKNNVPLPHDYDISLDGNVRWALSVIDRIRHEENFSLYIMPIRVDITTYLPRIFEKLS